ncbi:MAG: hypothetical protein ACHQ9S_14805 [Candidatus Binatia bacterium]
MSLLCTSAAIAATSTINRTDAAADSAPVSTWVSYGPPGKVDTFAVDPTNAQALYAGTGYGVYKSTDGGVSWVAMDGGLNGSPVLALALDPTNAQTLYAGGYGGVFQSTDGGASWSGMNNGLSNAHVQVLTLDPTNARKLYAGTDGGGVFQIQLQSLVCVGDCDGDGQVSVDEILTIVNIALGNVPLSSCTAGNANGKITVDEILTAVNNALNGCLPN